MTDWYVIYCLINNPDRIGHVLSITKREFFQSELAIEVYDYIRDLYTKNTKVTTEIIQSKFASQSEQLFLDCGIDAEAYEEYIEHQRQAYVNIEVRKLAQRITNSEKDIDTDKFSNYITDFVTRISYDTNTENIHNMDELIDIVIEQANQQEVFYHPVQFGVKSVDDWFNGFAPGDLIYIAGRPSMGKSAILGEICLHNALNGLKGVLFTIEQPPKMFTIRMLGSASDLEIWKLKRIKNRSEAEQKRVLETAERMKNMPLIVDDTASLDLNAIKSTLQKAILRFGKIDFIGIDYLQLMSGDDNLNDNARVSKLSRGLKLIGQQYNCPTFVCSQLSRGPEQRDNKRPLLSDMRDSGSIEQDADIVIMAYRDAYYTTNPEHERILEFLIRKWRNGPIGKIILDFDRQKQKIKEMNFNSQLGKIAKQFLYEN